MLLKQTYANRQLSFRIANQSIERLVLMLVIYFFLSASSHFRIFDMAIVDHVRPQLIAGHYRSSKRLQNAHRPTRR